MEFNLATVSEAIAEAIPDREAIVFGDRRFTYAELNDRTRRLANALIDHGLGIHTDRSRLENWESGQDHVGIYLYNGNEYLEAMLGAFKARAVPFNINYRYVDEELVYLLNNASCKALIYHSSLKDHVQLMRERVPTLELMIQVDDDGSDLLAGSIVYESTLAGGSNTRPDREWSPDDLYIIYTGGTTGMPKGVLWRQADMLIATLGGRRGNGHVLQTLDEYIERAQHTNRRQLPAPPFMHGAGHWNAFQSLHTGGTVVIPNEVKHLDAADMLDTIEREHVNNILIVGDAFGRPLADELHHRPRDLSSLKNIITGGAIMTAKIKQELIDAVPGVNIIDSVGSSETGGQGSQVSNAKSGASSGRFSLSEENAVLSEDLTHVLEPGHEGLGWWARTGNIPLGYLGDETKSKATFPEIGGTKFSIPGDKVKLLVDGTIELHGRDSATINSGGEKIFAEEVEQALKHHPAVFDAVVAGRPSERWGNEVVAIVQLRVGVEATNESLLEECAKHVARYKLPKAFVFKDQILRSPSGKADYRWAKRQVT
ncbi:MAG: acyl-CoA synthetase [Gammaproteobacteria bacterium]|nr:acyl-CoA synthetase [Gammaproteobacteria bacterium]